MTGDRIAPEQWQAAWALVQECSQLPPERWREHLESATADSQVADEALKILAESASLEAESPLPETVGSYRILRKIAEGGMGTVYRAEQANPRRIVALKVIKPGQATAVHVRRFELEGQMLGRLRHAGIAQIYESGTARTSFGQQPYFAMELVDGVSLLDFANRRNLDLRARLVMVHEICRAVQHAHEQGIIHRDLKPSNILVNEDGQPKVLDFGIARLTGVDASLTRHTGMGELLGTLEYMSPEQLTGDVSAVDVRTDIYALGVILYELLSGRVPYQVRDKPLPEAIRTIRDEEPVPLSVTKPFLHGDIKTIAGKALDKDKTRRYASAADLADDIGRFLDDQPITARPPSAAYQLQKFARRHRGLVWGAAVVALALVAGTAVSVYQAVRARRAEQAAISLVNFLRNDLLAQASPRMQGRPDTPPDPDLKVRTVLDRAAGSIGERFRDQPAVEASIRQTIGDTYLDLGLGNEARQHIEQAVELRRRALGDDHPDTLAAKERLALVYRFQGKYLEAQELLESTIRKRQRLQGEQHPDTLRAVGNLAAVYNNEGKYLQAVQILEPAVEASRRVFGQQHAETLQSLVTLASAYQEVKDFARAERIYARLVDIYRETKGESNPLTVVALSNLAYGYDREGKFAEAEPLLTRVLELSRSVLGEDHPSTLLYEHNLADLERKTGRAEQAEVRYGHVLDIRRRVLGEEHPYTLISWMAVGRSNRLRGDYEGAAQTFARVLEVRRRTQGEEHPYTLISMFELARTYDEQHRFQDAQKLYASVAAVRRRLFGAENPATLEAQLGIGRDLLAQRKYEDAETILRECVNGYAKTAPETWPRFGAQAALGASLAGKQRFEEAEALLLEGHQGLVKRQYAIPTEDQPVLALARSWLARLYEDWGKPERARQWR